MKKPNRNTDHYPCRGFVHDRWHSIHGRYGRYRNSLYRFRKNGLWFEPFLITEFYP